LIGRVGLRLGRVTDMFGKVRYSFVRVKVR
jgi:rRNA processing protein Gar1